MTLRRALIVLIRIYQLTLSPWLGANCRYLPSCSSYACQAIEQRGAARGVWLAVARLLRCHPFAAGGYDPVPAGRGEVERHAG
ncbi:MAG: membrane protein insertion efficiency factor YidD [Acidobacteriota bacterium]